MGQLISPCLAPSVPRSWKPLEVPQQSLETQTSEGIFLLQSRRGADKLNPSLAGFILSPGLTSMSAAPPQYDYLASRASYISDQGWSVPRGLTYGPAWSSTGCSRDRTAFCPWPRPCLAFWAPRLEINKDWLNRFCSLVMTHAWLRAWQIFTGYTQREWNV